jgi:hypothetical protein
MIAIAIYPTLLADRPAPAAAAAAARVQEVARGIQHHLKPGHDIDGPHDGLQLL